MKRVSAGGLALITTAVLLCFAWMGYLFGVDSERKRQAARLAPLGKVEGEPREGDVLRFVNRYASCSNVFLDKDGNPIKTELK